MKKTTITIIAVLVAIIAYFTLINYASFDIQTQNDAKIAGFGLLLGISFIVTSYFNKKNPKKNRAIIRSILIFDLYILGTFFLKKDLNINGIEFAIFFIFLLLLILNSFINHRIKKIIGILLGIGLLFFLSKSILPDFETNPLEKTNILNKDQIIIQNMESSEDLQQNNTKVIINRDKNDKTINITQSLQEEINITLVKKISFLSKSDNIKTNLYILVGEDIISLKPQSSITFSKSGNRLLIDSEIGNSKVWLYTNQENGSLIGGKNIKSEKLQEIGDIEIMKNIQKIKNNKILEQNGGFLLENYITRNITKTILDISFYFFPTQYKNNLENFETVVKLLKLENQINNSEKSGISTGDTESILKQIKKGYGKTYLKLSF